VAKFVFNKIMTGEEISDILQKELDPSYRMNLKKNRIEIVQDTTKACIFLFKEKDGRTECTSPSGYMPLGLPRAVIIFGSIAILAVLFYQNNNYLILGIGALILSLLMRLPSQSLVEKVSGVLRKVANEE
jgi:hypothetical protein